MVISMANIAILGTVGTASYGPVNPVIRYGPSKIDKARFCLAFFSEDSSDYKWAQAYSTGWQRQWAKNRNHRSCKRR